MSERQALRLLASSGQSIKKVRHDTSFLSGRFWVTMDVSDTSSALTFSEADELVEHNVWNPMLGLFCHADIGIFMAAPVDEKKGSGKNCSVVPFRTRHLM